MDNQSFLAINEAEDEGGGVVSEDGEWADNTGDLADVDAVSQLCH